MFPTSLQGIAGPIASQLPITPFNLVCTNVPGPQVPLYLLGHKMLHCYPYVPVGGEMAVNCAILSYNGTVYFGFSGDTHAAPDLRRLEKLLQESFGGLREAVGIRPRKKKTIKLQAAPATANELGMTPSASVPTARTTQSKILREQEPALSTQPENVRAHLVVA